MAPPMNKEQQRRLQSKAARDRALMVRAAIAVLTIGAVAAWAMLLFDS